MIYNFRGENSERIKFNRKLFQYKIQSHKGKYQTVSKGILKKCEKPVRSVVIFDREYLNKVKQIMNKSKAKYNLYEVSRKLK